jgi:hypothetical protein
VCVLLERFWVIYEAHQENASRHESNLCDKRSFLPLHTHVISYSLAHFLSKLLCYTFCNVYGGKSSGLSADDVNILLVMHTPLEDVLGHLSGFAASCVTWNYQNFRLLKFCNDLLSVPRDWKIFGSFNGLSDLITHQLRDFHRLLVTGVESFISFFLKVRVRVIIIGPTACLGVPLLYNLIFLLWVRVVYPFLLKRTFLGDSLLHQGRLSHVDVYLRFQTLFGVSLDIGNHKLD